MGHKHATALLLFTASTLLVASYVAHSATDEKAGKFSCEVISLADVRLKAKEKILDQLDRLVDEVLPEMERMGHEFQNTYPAGNIHSDPLACRYCHGFTAFLLETLNKRMPQQKWAVYTTPSNRNFSFFGGFLHQYLYSPQLDVIVDPTYRQFLVKLPKGQFRKLPRVFVGSPREFRGQMSRYIPPLALDIYFNALAELP